MKHGKLIFKIILWAFGVAILGYIAVISYLLLGSKINSYTTQIPFDSQQWQSSLNSHDSIKQNMVNDLLSRHTLVGMNKSQVVHLLGRPPGTNYFKNYDFVYWLGPERSAISIDSQWLGLKFENDVVIKAEILTD